MGTMRKKTAEALAHYFLSETSKIAEEIASWPEERRRKAIEQADAEGPPPELVKEVQRWRRTLKRLTRENLDGAEKSTR